MKTFRTEGTGALERMRSLAEPLSEMKERLTDTVSDASGRVAEARESAGEAISESPLRWTLVALGVGLFVGLLLSAARRSGY